jgi:YidC/Oxa1 family membrane protein insertase
MFSRITHTTLRRTINSSNKGSFQGLLIKPIISTTPNAVFIRSFSDIPDSKIGSSVSDHSLSISDSVSSLINENILDTSTTVVAHSLDEQYFIAAKIMEGIDYFHTFAGIPYWEAIVGATFVTRFLLFPVVLQTMKNTAIMARLRPEMQKVQEAQLADPNGTDAAVKMRYQNEMKAIFSKYKVNPFRMMLWPFVQFPVFIAFFMALKDFGLYFPQIADGGAFWFTNLAAADPYYILPVINAASFLLMIEIGQDGVKMDNQQQFKNIMRFLGVAMVPLTASMPACLFVYWGSNNIFSIAQTLLMKNEKVREFFKIPKLPKAEDTPALKVKSPVAMIKAVSFSSFPLYLAFFRFLFLSSVVY